MSSQLRQATVDQLWDLTPVQAESIELTRAFQPSPVVRVFQTSRETGFNQARLSDPAAFQASKISHEYNELLTAILGYSQLAMKKLAESDPIRRDLEQVEKAARRAAELTKELVAVVAQKRYETTSHESKSIEAVLSNIQSMLQRLTGESDDYTRRSI